MENFSHFKLKTTAKEILFPLFQASFFTYLFFLLLDEISPGFVSNWFNINIILAIAVAAGLGLVFINQPLPVKSQKNLRPYYILASLLALICAGIVWVQLEALGWLAYVLSLLVLLLVISFSLVIFNDHK